MKIPHIKTDFQLAEYFISEGAKFDKKKNKTNLIFEAISSNEFKKTIKLLISEGVDINGKIYDNNNTDFDFILFVT